jgi:hypothetical protein
MLWFKLKIQERKRDTQREKKRNEDWWEGAKLLSTINYVNLTFIASLTIHHVQLSQFADLIKILNKRFLIKSKSIKGEEMKIIFFLAKITRCSARGETVWP